ncbi:unnamed protein product, partial [Staurois parvus]
PYQRHDHLQMPYLITTMITAIHHTSSLITAILHTSILITTISHTSVLRTPYAIPAF